MDSLKTNLSTKLGRVSELLVLGVLRLAAVPFLLIAIALMALIYGVAFLLRQMAAWSRFSLGWSWGASGVRDHH